MERKVSSDVSGTFHNPLNMVGDPSPSIHDDVGCVVHGHVVVDDEKRSQGFHGHVGKISDSSQCTEPEQPPPAALRHKLDEIPNESVNKSHASCHQKGTGGRAPDDLWRNSSKTVEHHGDRESPFGTQGSQRNGQGKVRPPMRHAMIELKKASKKKSDLVDYVNNKLMAKTRGTETIQELQRLGTKKIYQTTAASPEDPVGFGEHCSLQYHELLAQHPQYASWVVKTATEGECDYRLARLIPSGQLAPEPRGTASDADLQADLQRLQEHIDAGQRLEWQDREHDDADDADDARPHKEDVDNLKAERPHKKVEASSVSEMTESSTGSFVPIPQ